MHKELTEQLKTNVIIITEAGKPVFARFGDEEEMMRVCGLVRSICISLACLDGEGSPTVRSMKSGKKQLLFLFIGSFTLVALSPINSRRHGPSEAFLRLQLEYLYSIILSTVTDQIQRQLNLDPSTDVRSVLGTTVDSLLKSGLDEMDTHPGPFMTSALPVCHPLPAFERDKVSHILRNVGDKTPNTLYSMIFFQSQMVTIVQASFLPLHISDMLMLLHIVNRQRNVTMQDQQLWIPICLPRIHPSRYFHVYLHTLSQEANLVLVSNVGDTEQFNRFCAAASSIRTQLGLPRNNASASIVLEIRRPIPSDNEEDNSDFPSDVLWRRLRISNESDSEEDYVDVARDDDGLISYAVDASDINSDMTTLGCVKDESSFFVEALQLSSSSRDALWTNEYLKELGALHLLLRCDIPVRNDVRRSHHRATTMTLPQSIVSPFLPPLRHNELGQQNVWYAYQRLSLRMRTGSSRIEVTFDELDKIAISYLTKSLTTINGHSNMPSEPPYYLVTHFLELLPSVHGMSYLSNENFVHLALSGANFECFMTLPTSVNLQEAVASSMQLTQRIIHDRSSSLFVSNPLLFDNA